MSISSKSMCNSSPLKPTLPVPSDESSALPAQGPVNQSGGCRGGSRQITEVNNIPHDHPQARGLRRFRGAGSTLQIIITISQQWPPGLSGDRPPHYFISPTSGKEKKTRVDPNTYWEWVKIEIPPHGKPIHFNECNLSFPLSMSCALIMMLMVSVGVVLHAE